MTRVRLQSVLVSRREDGTGPEGERNRRNGRNGDVLWIEHSSCSPQPPFTRVGGRCMENCFHQPAFEYTTEVESHVDEATAHCPASRCDGKVHCAGCEASLCLELGW